MARHYKNCIKHWYDYTSSDVPTTEPPECEMSESNLWAVKNVCLISCLKIALSRSIMLSNYSCVNTITIRNLWCINEVISESLRDKLSSNHGVIARILMGFDPEDLSGKSSCCSGNEENNALAEIHSQTLAAKNTLKYYSEFYSLFLLLLQWLLFDIYFHRNITTNWIGTTSDIGCW